MLHGQQVVDSSRVEIMHHNLFVFGKLFEPV